MAKDIPSENEIVAQRKKLAELEAQRLEGLREKRRAARKVVADLDAQIAKITGKAPPTARRKKTSSEEMRSKIFGALSANPKGLRLIELEDKTKLPYVSINNFLKNHPKEIRWTGKRKRKRYFLRSS